MLQLTKHSWYAVQTTNSTGTKPSVDSAKKNNILQLPQYLNHLLTLVESNDFDNALETQRLQDCKANIIIKKKQTHLKLVNYLHAACFSPTKSTFISAIEKGFLKSWPGLTTKKVEKYLKDSVATAQGHLNQQQQHLQSTKTAKNNIHPIDGTCAKITKLQLNNAYKHGSAAVTDNNFSSSSVPNTNNNIVAHIVINHNYDKIGYIDTTGRFPQQSSREHEYVLIGYYYNGNAILGTPLKDRSETSLTKAWQTIHQTFANATNAPNIYVLDNEKPTESINSFTNNNISYQLDPPHNHRTNIAERTIQTFKSHFKAGLATCDS